MLVESVMTRDVITVSVDDPVEKCAGLLMKHDISGLPVLDSKGRLAGIITEGDLIRRAGRIKAPGYLEILGGLVYLGNPGKFVSELQRTMSLCAGEMMTNRVVSIHPSDTVEEAATKMIEKKISRLPVINEDGKLVGILSRRDIMHSLYSSDADHKK